MAGIKDGYLYLATKIVTGLIGLVSISLQTKYISAAVMGQYSLITGITSICMTIMIGWLASSSLRYYHQYSFNARKLFFSTISIDWVICTSITVLFVILLSYIIKSIPLKDYLLLISLLIVNSSAFQIYEGLLRASKHNVLYCVLLLIQSILHLVIIVIVNTVFELQIESLFIANIVTPLVFVIVSMIALRSIQDTSFSSYDKSLNNKLFEYGLPLIGVWGISWLLGYSDRYIISFYYSSSDVGLYDIAYRFSESSIGLIIAAFDLAFFPEMIRCWHDDGKKATETLMTSVFRVLLSISIPAVIGLSLLSDSLYGTIIDPSYSEAAGVISVSCVGFVFLGINNVLYKIWELEEKTTRILSLTIIAMLINIISNFVFIPLFGYIAAAWTTVGAYVCITILAVIMLHKHFKIILDTTSLLKEIIAASLMGILVFFIRPFVTNTIALLLVVLLAAVFYFALLVLFKDIDKEVYLLYFKRNSK